MTKKSILKKLKSVIDPELGVSIVDLGLVYNISVKNGIVNILMTTTTPACPLVGRIEEEIQKALRKDPRIKKLNITLTFNPPWNIDRISKIGKEKLGILK